ncbi:hypothetical protein ORF056R [Spotted knifejaw iridovirus]|nr:hypothetical protein ORF056R [Spotted knifejaw iridovirus]
MSCTGLSGNRARSVHGLYVSVCCEQSARSLHTRRAVRMGGLLRFALAPVSGLYRYCCCLSWRHRYDDIFLYTHTHLLLATRSCVVLDDLRPLTHRATLYHDTRGGANAHRHTTRPSCAAVVAAAAATYTAQEAVCRMAAATTGCVHCSGPTRP